MAGQTNDATKQAQLAHGHTVIQYSDGATPTPKWTTIARVRTAPPLSETKNFVDVTTLDSKNRAREFIPGLTSPEEFSMNMLYLPNEEGQELLRRDFKSGALRNYRIIYSQPEPVAGKNQKYYAFCAFVSAMSKDAGDIEAAVEQVVTFRPSGDISQEDVITFVPTAFTATAGATGEVDLVVTAGADPDIVGIQFYRSSTVNSSEAYEINNGDAVEATSGQAGLAFTDTGLATGDQFYYFARTLNSLNVLSEFTAVSAQVTVA